MHTKMRNCYLETPHVISCILIFFSIWFCVWNSYKIYMIEVHINICLWEISGKRLNHGCKLVTELKQAELWRGCASAVCIILGRGWHFYELDHANLIPGICYCHCHHHWLHTLRCNEIFVLFAYSFSWNFCRSCACMSLVAIVCKIFGKNVFAV